MGGAEKVVSTLVDELAARGHEVVLAYLTGPAVVLPLNPKVKIISFDMRSRRDIFGVLIKLRRLICDFRPQVVHSHMIHANILARIARLYTPIPRLISTAHSSNEGGKLRMLAYRLTDMLADISTNVSTAAVEAFIKAKAAPSGRFITVHNGISTDLFHFDVTSKARIHNQLSIKEDERLILAVGRFHEAKDYPNLFYAIAELSPSAPKYKLCVVGDGPLRSALQTLTVQLNIADRILFMGVRHDVPDLMSAADVFVLPSAWEGFGLVVAEAMACQCVVVATDCGGVKEVLDNVGYLVKPQDPKALALALQTALQLPADERVALGRAARKRVVEHYSLDIAVERWLKIYTGQVSAS